MFKDNVASILLPLEPLALERDLSIRGHPHPTEQYHGYVRTETDSEFSSNERAEGSRLSGEGAIV